jgi:hypothetical protein
MDKDVEYTFKEEMRNALLFVFLMGIPILMIFGLRWFFLTFR